MAKSTLVVRKSDHRELFGLSPEGDLYNKYFQDGAWSNWAKLRDGAFTGIIGTHVIGPENIEIYLRRDDGRVFEFYFANGTWDGHDRDLGGNIQ